MRVASASESQAELHFHLLPGVDDGPTTMADSLELAEAAVADGSSIVVATPHIRHGGVLEPLLLPGMVAELRAHLAGAGVPLEIHCGGELAHELVGRLGQHELQTIAHGPASGRWLLVEAPFEGIGADFHASTAELRARGFGVLIAHPERSADALLDGGAGLHRELAAGSLAQVNAMSLVGAHGEEVRAAAAALVVSGAVAAIASDAHGPTRPPALSLARAALAALDIQPETIEQLVCAAPRQLLARGISMRAAPLAA
ncbi:MAG TPA: CpsB/CapC family capsule biosynthesis tyrosine phosphatase [Thermoleophilaceae bacterium]